MRFNKQGSALLIVLGFLSFMVVSAVAFAIYMRAERMPSSALRRAVATRHLVRAALAEAISRVDDAVRDDPFPGLCATNNNGTVEDQGNAKFYYYRNGSGGKQAIDVWDGRVFMPPDPQGGTIDAETRYAPVSETVSVLTLEGLGYVPPPLVNDVRFLSRSSWAASWQPLPFDSGRFAYCAVNVSDYLDINRIPANKPRTAEAQRRLSVAHLFDQNFDPYDVFNNNNIKGSSVDNPDSSAASTFDDFSGKKAGSPYSGYVPGDNVGGTYEKWTAIGNTSPYVSMMDYNLALASGGPNSYFKPLFYNWLADKRRDKSYYIQDSSRSSEMYAALKQPFVTDSWSTNETWDVDISTTEGQPFKGMQSLLDSEGKASLQDVKNNAVGNAFFRAMESSSVGLVGDADYMTLFDYLDYDDIPLSLAMPCVERVPMIAGLTPPQFALSKFEDPTGSGDPGDPQIWKFDARKWFDDGKGMRVVIPFPFRRGLPQGNFNAQILLRMVFAPAGTDKFILASKVRPDKSVWQTPGRRMDDPSVFSFTCLSKQKSFTIPQNVLNDESACVSGEGVLEFTFGDFPNNFSPPVEVVRMEKEHKLEADGTQGPLVPYYTVSISPLDDQGNSIMPIGEKLDATTFNSKSGLECVPYVFMWVRILNPDGKTVDLVPAGFYDDEVLGGRTASGQAFDELQDLCGQAGDAARPIFAFIGKGGDPATVFSFNALMDSTFSGRDVEWTVDGLDPIKGVYALDPRFNYSPEQWYVEKTKVDFDGWLDNTRKALKQVDRDSDIFMFVSNQGFLQSIGELGFLPYLHEIGASNPTYVPGLGRVDPSGHGSFSPSAQTVMDNFKYMWNTYRQDEVYRQLDKAVSPNKIGCSHQRECLVNPHTGDLGVMMAALANTPADYWSAAAGVDKTCELFKNLGSGDEPLENFSKAKEYAFNSARFDGKKSGTKITYQELVLIAKTIMTAMGGVNLQDSDEAVANVKDVLSSVDKSKVRNSIAKELKKRIRDGNGAVKPSNVWQIIWDELWAGLAFNSVDPDKSESFEEILGVSLSEPLYGVDRKFLYSYWRDCFANNQQLFLIFVRAESSALGGPGEGTPAQLGGRAVALVWRDPDWSEGDGDNGRDRDWESENQGHENRQRPHRTRVLFYHQFD